MSNTISPEDQQCDIQSCEFLLQSYSIVEKYVYTFLYL